MAHCKFLIPAEIRGKVGNLVFKNRHGKDYVSPLPRPNHKLTDTNSVFNQEQFRFISEFTTAVNKIKFIKDIWMQKYPDCYGSYQEIYKSNFRDFLYTDLTGKPKLTPGKGFILKNPTVEIINGKISLTAGPLAFFQRIKCKYLTSVVLIVFRPKDSTDLGKFEFLCLKGGQILYTPESSIHLEMYIECYINQCRPNYIITQVYIFIATLDRKGRPIRYSETISHFIPIPTPEVVELEDSSETSQV